MESNTQPCTHEGSNAIGAAFCHSCEHIVSPCDFTSEMTNGDKIRGKRARVASKKFKAAKVQ